MPVPTRTRRFPHTALLILEWYLGRLIRDDGKDNLTAVHVPLAMLIMGSAGILAARAWRLHRTATRDNIEA